MRRGELAAQCLMVFVFTVIFTAFHVAESKAQNRVALVIGNSVYPNLPKVPALPNPQNDALAMGKELRASGFDTIEITNATVHQMDDAIDRLITKIGPQSEVVVFYAGHGIEVKGANWLLPSDINEDAVGSETRLPRAAVNLAQTLTRIQERGARFSVFILDACREDPFPQRLTRSVGSRGGLAAVNPPDGVFLMFSAAPGQYANDKLSTADKNPNSPYTRHLLELMKKDGLDLGELAKQLQERVAKDTQNLRNKQRPGHYDGASGRFFFRPPSVMPAAPVAQTPTPAPAVAAINQPQTRSVVADDPWKRLPFVSESHRENARKPHLARTGEKAIAFTSNGLTFSTGSTDATVNENEIRKIVLQQCEFHHRQNCFVGVVGNRVLDAGPQGYQPASVLQAVLADDAKVSATEVPFNPPSMRKKFKVYGGLKGHRAAAINMWSYLTWANSSVSSEDAQRRALKSCQDAVSKSAKNSAGESAPPCLLYAIDDRVVLKDRLIEHITPSKLANPALAVVPGTQQTPANVSTSSAAQRPFKASEAKFGKAEELKELETANRPWSIAVENHTKLSRWDFTYWGSGDSERDLLALQRCEFIGRKPCAIVARNGFWLPATSGRYQAKSVLAERGPFVAANVPFVPSDRTLSFGSYAETNGFKALAVHPAGHHNVQTASFSQAQSEVDALNACNAAAKKQWGFDCFLYAVGNDVVLYRRATKPQSISAVTPISSRPFKASEAKFAGQASLKALTELEANREDWALAVESTTEKKIWFGATWRGQPIGVIEIIALQRCEFYAKTPCILYARNGQVIEQREVPPRSPKLIERGAFDVVNIPFMPIELRKGYEFYDRLNGNKAMAIHVSGVAAARTGDTSGSAQTQALDACNALAKKKWGADCVLYAIDRELVLHRRTTKSIN